MLATDVTIRAATLAEVRPFIGPLLEEHWAEIALDRDTVKLDPLWTRYEQLEDAGVLHILAVWDGGALVGYSVNVYVDQHPHYAGLSYLQNDVFFLKSTHRRGRLGARLLGATEALAKELGAAMVLLHAKEHTPMQTLLAASGYRVQDVMYSRRV